MAISRLVAEDLSGAVSAYRRRTGDPREAMAPPARLPQCCSMRRRTSTVMPLYNFPLLVSTMYTCHGFEAAAATRTPRARRHGEGDHSSGTLRRKRLVRSYQAGKSDDDESLSLTRRSTSVHDKLEVHSSSTMGRPSPRHDGELEAAMYRGISSAAKTLERHRGHHAHLPSLPWPPLFSSQQRFNTSLRPVPEVYPLVGAVGAALAFAAIIITHDRAPTTRCLCARRRAGCRCARPTRTRRRTDVYFARKKHYDNGLATCSGTNPGSSRGSRSGPPG